uniref:MADS-box domain-containing protein n=1 Tax=Kalanchoe fedtschenkoi TaxID=63787 RepID=A0A7N0TCH2_KALFE
MGTGRKRIEIHPIHDISRRRVTLTKRRQGLFKKMDKLCKLTGCTAAAIVFSTAGRPYSFGDLSLFDAFTGSEGQGREDGGGYHLGGSRLGLGRVSEPEGVDGSTGSGVEGGPSTSYSQEIGGGGGDGDGSFQLGFGESEGVNDLDGFMEELSSLLEMRSKVFARLNRHVEGFGGDFLPPQPLSIIEIDAPPLPLH